MKYYIIYFSLSKTQFKSDQMYFDVSAVKTVSAMKTVHVFPPASCLELSLDGIDYPVLQDTFVRTVQNLLLHACVFTPTTV